MSRPVLVAPSFPSGPVGDLVRGRLLVAAASWHETLSVGGLLLLIACGFLSRLPAVIISDMDEGTYLYAGKLLASGQAPYRDFLLAHPPLAVLLSGGWQWLFGSAVMPARIAYLVLTLASTISLYAIGRALARSHLAGLLAIAAYTTGMLLLANMGRTVRLEPLMNAFLLAGFAAYLLRPDSLRVRALVGALLAGAVLVKLVAVVPAGLLVIADACWARPGRRFLPSWLVAAGGAALVLVPSAVVLLSQPGFVDDVLRSQLNRPGLPLETRLFYFRQASLRYPIIPFALASSLWFLVRSGDWRLRTVSMVALGSTLTLVFGFRTFFGYYLVQVLPWLAVLFAVCATRLLERAVSRWARHALIAGTLTLGVAVPPIYAEVYHRTAHDHVSSPAQIVSLLRQETGYIYSMYPGFALWSERDLYPWPYVADSLIPRITGEIGDEDFVRVFSGCQSLVLWPGELTEYPLARAYVESHFRVAYKDEHYTLWSRATG